MLPSLKENYINHLMRSKYFLFYKTLNYRICRRQGDQSNRAPRWLIVAKACHQTWIQLFLFANEVSVRGIHQTSSNFMDSPLRWRVSKQEGKAHLLLLSEEGMLGLWKRQYLLSSPREQLGDYVRCWFRSIFSECLVLTKYKSSFNSPLINNSSKTFRTKKHFM